MARLPRIVPLLSLVLLAGAGTPRSCAQDGDLAKYGPAEFDCVAAKQSAGARYGDATFRAWADWAKGGDAAWRDRDLDGAGRRLAHAFSSAEWVSAERGVDCVEQTVAADDLEGIVGAAVLDVLATLEGAGGNDACIEDVLDRAGARTRRYLQAEALHTRKAPHGGAAEIRDSWQEKAARQFQRRWNDDCGGAAVRADVETRLDALSDQVVFATSVAPGLDDSEFQPVSPVGPIEYEGRELNPRCGFDDDPDYHFFVKRGSVNKLVMYYQGGGACWENLTCGIPVCKNGADPVADDPDNATAGFADLGNPDNPFKDWNAVFVTYCTCDIHFGDIDQVYSGFFGDVAVSHRGFQNAKVAEKFAREHFLNPEVVFVTGSSAGGYGALFHAPLLHDVWTASRFRVLGDASNGVITSDFLQNEFENWNFEANLPDDPPGVRESIESGEGMVGYIESVADYLPDSNWAHYTTAYDGDSGGQTGFYNVMLNGNNPAAALTWWGGTCPFNEVMVDQALETFARAPDNYRYYIGAGSRHTMYGSDKVYTDQSGGESQTIVDWVEDMIDFQPGQSSPADWQNVECTDCGLVLPGDPRPPVIPTDPFFDDMGQTVILCSE